MAQQRQKNRKTWLRVLDKSSYTFAVWGWVGAPLLVSQSAEDDEPDRYLTEVEQHPDHHPNNTDDNNSKKYKSIISATEPQSSLSTVLEMS